MVLVIDFVFRKFVVSTKNSAWSETPKAKGVVNVVECVTVPMEAGPYRHMHDCLPVAKRTFSSVACDPWNVAASKLIRSLGTYSLMLLGLHDDGQRGS
jgi:hypothetical protein